MPIMQMGCFSFNLTTHNAASSSFFLSQNLLHSHSQCGLRVVTLNKRVSQNSNSIVLHSTITTKTFASGNGIQTETAVVEEKTQLGGRFQVSRGYPTPFGATVRDGGVNFAIYSLNALSATLCLITLSDFQNVSSSFLILSTGNWKCWNALQQLKPITLYFVQQ